MGYWTRLSGLVVMLQAMAIECVVFGMTKNLISNLY